MEKVRGFEVAKGFENANIKLIELSENMTLYDSTTEEYEVRGEKGHSITCDLHIWLNPIYMQIMADKIYDAYHQEIELTPEQQACLKYTGDRTLMVKGYAGAGKSLVLMAIAQKYLEKYGHEQKNKVAIFTFQNTLVSTTKEFLQVNGGDEEGVVVSTVNSYLKLIYDDLVRQGKAPRQSYPNSNKKDKK